MKRISTKPFNNYKQFVLALLMLLFIVCGISSAQSFIESYVNIEGSSNGIVKWVDVNNDNYLDIFICGANTNKPAFSTIYLNVSGSQFIKSQINFDALNYASADWADFDGDGDLDLLISGKTANANPTAICKIYRNNLSNGFTDINAGLIGLYNGTTDWFDYDNDGDLDIITTGIDNEGNINTCVYENSNGIFTVIETMLPDVYNGSVTICDFDKDNDMDIILSGKISFNPYQNEVITKVFLNTKGTYKEKELTFPKVYSSYISWGDYNSDGKADVLLSGLTNINSNIMATQSISRIYVNDNGFTDIFAGMTGIYDGISLWGDSNNDGMLDVLLSGGVLGDSSAQNPNNRVTKIYLNRSGTYTQLTNTPFMDLTNVSGAWGDFDNDNDLDILIAGKNHQDLDVTRIYSNQNDIANNVPVEPKGLTTSIDNEIDRYVLLQWLPGYDFNSPSKSLTYNLRIGTTPGGSEIMAPSSEFPTGYVKIPERGNVDNNLSWRIYNLPPGKYYWSVQSVDNSFAGSEFTPEQTFIVTSSTSVTQISSEIPDNFEIQQNYPNPFNPSTKIRYSLPGSANVKVTVFDLSGKEIAELVNASLNAGVYELTWNAGANLSSGVYFYTIESEFGRVSKKMLLVK